MTESGWQVLSNTSECQFDESKLTEFNQILEQFGATDAFTSPKITAFKESPRISTYAYAIVAGNYQYHERKTEGLPLMRIYARKSLFADVEPDEMFNITQAGIKFYSQYFSTPYPFDKYDQVFVPEHNWGAMENIGCVTFNESYLCRGEEKSLAKRTRFGITNLHELAHMWFGNLVTMKWWNDLWLNESFATFMSLVSMTRSEGLEYFNTAWISFLQYTFWGINTDVLSSTHPIKAIIHDTAEAESIFDGISYGKGA